MNEQFDSSISLKECIVYLRYPYNEVNIIDIKITKLSACIFQYRGGRKLNPTK
jgi:hypothetical protein